VPLSEKTAALLDEAIDNARLESSGLSSIDIGERIREMVDLLHGHDVVWTTGPLHRGMRDFEGSDQFFESGDKRARVIVCDLTRRPLVAVLEDLQHEDGHTLLIRGAALGAVGQVSQELLHRFQAANHFLQLSSADMATLAGLGSLLADMRDGHFDQLVTEPPPTRSGVLGCLRNSPLLRNTKAWSSIQMALEGRVASPAVNGIHAAPVTITSRVSTSTDLPHETTEALRAILSSERWMEIHRLQKRLQEVGCACSLESLRRALREAELATHVIMHPAESPVSVGGPQIILWNDSLD
jgi:hypothetical protein